MKSVVGRVKEDAFVERRRHRRYKPEISAFVSVKNATFPRMCRLLDISSAGLAFSCIGNGEGVSDRCKLDIMLPNPFCYLKKMPFELISDCRMEINSVTGFATRRCGVRFEKLDQDQKSYLTMLIDTLLALPWGFSIAA